MSKMVIINPSSRGDFTRCAYEEACKGKLVKCAKTPVVKYGRINLCLEHAEFVISSQGSSLELLDANNLPLNQRKFLNLMRAEAQ